MARAEDSDLRERFEEFYREHYHDEIETLAEDYPHKQKSLCIDWRDLYEHDADLADDYRNHPEQFQDYAEEALQLFDLPLDVKLGHVHVRIENLPEPTPIPDIRSDHRGMLLEVPGIVETATDVEPKITTAAFECQRCGTLTRIPQADGDFQEPHECQGCEQKGPFRINYDQSKFIDGQELTLVPTPGATSENTKRRRELTVELEDDLTGRVKEGQPIIATGVMKLDQQGTAGNNHTTFDVYLTGHALSAVDPAEDEVIPSYLGIDPDGVGVPEATLERFVQTADRALTESPVLDELNTQAKVITPFVHALGWNVYDNAEVLLEYSGDEDFDQNADYVLCGPDGPHIVIEAKRQGRALGPHESQLKRYMRLFAVEWGILTNGREYEFYRRLPDENREILLRSVSLTDLPECDLLAIFSREAAYGESTAIPAWAEAENRDELDADVIKTGISTSQREQITEFKDLIAAIENEYDEGAPVERVLERAVEAGMDRATAKHEITKLKRQGDAYEPKKDHLRTT